MANSCGRAARGDDVGRERFAVLRKMLLMVCQRARGLDEDWTVRRRMTFWWRL